MLGYIARFLENVYDFINPNYVNIRLARFEELSRRGQLEKMCSSEVHRIFGISGESSEI